MGVASRLWCSYGRVRRQRLGSVSILLWQVGKLPLGDVHDGSITQRYLIGSLSLRGKGGIPPAAVWQAVRVIGLLEELIVFGLIVCGLPQACGRGAGSARPLSLCGPSSLPQRFVSGAAAAGDASLLFLSVVVVKCVLFG